MEFLMYLSVYWWSYLKYTKEGMITSLDSVHNERNSALGDPNLGGGSGKALLWEDNTSADMKEDWEVTK